MSNSFPANTTFTFTPCCDEAATSPIIINNFQSPVYVCSSTTPSRSGAGSVTAVGCCPSCNLTQSGLVLWYDAGNENSYSGSTNLLDLTTNNNDTVLSSGVTYFPNIPQVYGSLLFDGAGDDGLDGNNASIQLSTGCTVEAFIRPTGFTNSPNIISKDSNNGYRLRINTSGNINFIADGSAINYTSSPTVLTANTWAHVVATHGPSGGNLYLNGTSVGSNGDPFGTVTNVSSLRVGRFQAGSPQEYFQGYIAIIRIYNRELSSTEVTNNFNSEKDRFGL